nr:class I SAM-dependent methyltransferase [Mycobacterium montefiorense]
MGATATGVAVGRALAGRAPNPLIHDPFAEPLVRAVGVNSFTRLAGGELDPATVDDNGDSGMVGLGAMMADRIRVVTEQWREHGFDIEMTDLWYAGDRNDVVDYLSSHGWTTFAATVPELAANYGLSLPPRPAGPVDKEETLSAMHYVTATRS